MNAEMTVQHKRALGVKTADGAIVPVLDFSSQSWNQAVFSTVRDRQNKAVFDFYYREEGTRGWMYLDSLPLIRIPPAPAGQPELRVRTQVDARGNLSLQIQDPGAPKPFSFVLKAETLGRMGHEVEAGRTSAGTSQEKVRKGKRSWLLVLAPVAVLLVASLFLLDRNPVSLPRKSDAQMPGNAGAVQPETRSSINKPPAEIEAGVTDTSASQAKALEEARDRPAIVETHSKGEYLITWGDTLWRIAEQFYGNRALYPSLADANQLPDPDVIIAGKALLLPSLLQEDRRSR